MSGFESRNIHQVFNDQVVELMERFDEDDREQEERDTEQEKRGREELEGTWVQKLEMIQDPGQSENEPAKEQAMELDRTFDDGR